MTPRNMVNKHTLLALSDVQKIKQIVQCILIANKLMECKLHKVEHFAWLPTALNASASRQKNNINTMNSVHKLLIKLSLCISYIYLPIDKKLKVIPVQAVGVLRVARGWGSHTFRHSTHWWRQGCQPYAPAAIYPQEDSWYSFLSEAESTPGP
jgi:hypothetical protein